MFRTIGSKCSLTTTLLQMHGIRLEDVYALRDRYTGVAVSCNNLQDYVRTDLDMRGITPQQYIGAPLDCIAQSLLSSGISYIALADSLEIPEKEHYFTLFLIDGEVYRLEMYTDKFGIVYHPRVVEWNTYVADLEHLSLLPAGWQRVGYWNGLFNAREAGDAPDNLTIEVNGVVYD